MSEAANSPQQPPQPVCGIEAVELLNCVASPQYEQDRCASLLDSLRKCILSKNVKKFTLAGEGQPQTHPKAAKEMDLNSKVARGTS
ncbi:uncharacterized protein LOC18429856 [Amborella trichopoda]|uniref:uncharacterized protein LOC18429856 n=1 Tax=Amborella trichopoda TaxID=13333 RepID=UPI0005D33878|nr:uncharacterized protein LOC18429856 [Amborella trichopoda]|eukprot:XP_011621802.1 uncharacterized protein LOC18429856 [Amborella trichopoda]